MRHHFPTSQWTGVGLTRLGAVLHTYPADFADCGNIVEDVRHIRDMSLGSASPDTWHGSRWQQRSTDVSPNATSSRPFVRPGMPLDTHCSRAYFIGIDSRGREFEIILAADDRDDDLWHA